MSVDKGECVFSVDISRVLAIVCSRLGVEMSAICALRARSINGCFLVSGVHSGDYVFTCTVYV